MRVACFTQKSFSTEGHHPLSSQAFREKHQQFQVFGCWFVARLSGGSYCHPPSCPFFQQIISFLTVLTSLLLLVFPILISLVSHSKRSPFPRSPKWEANQILKGAPAPAAVHRALALHDSKSSRLLPSQLLTTHWHACGCHFQPYSAELFCLFWSLYLSAVFHNQCKVRNMKEIQQDNQLVATWLAARRLHTASWGSCVSTTHQWRLRIKFINCQWREIKNKQTSCTGSAFPRNKTKEDRFNLHTHCPMAHSDLRNVFWISCGCPYCSDRIHAPSIMF